ncbi:PUR family DNA/RNA-binding protein [Bacteroides sp.]|uniref:PUR family DNA/RNA-binding protein n=1 Tax=Bacteroides sp. TaxID=29523 RepID=UPI0026068191|nr:PUR family DNA/RNA-binding protein [Bacteroides sp.]
MEDFKKKNAADMNDKEIVFSQSIKAGKRIYYLDVKKNRKDEMFLAITESKKIVMGEGEDSQVSFEKHKIFLYKEDFEKFMNGLQQAVHFIQEQQGSYSERNDNEEIVGLEKDKAELQEEKISSLDGEIKIDIDF